MNRSSVVILVIVGAVILVFTQLGDFESASSNSTSDYAKSLLDELAYLKEEVPEITWIEIESIQKDIREDKSYNGKHLSKINTRRPHALYTL